MKISLPEEARSYFDGEARKLLFELRPAPKEDNHKKNTLSSSHQFIDHVLEDVVIKGSISYSTIDNFGKRKAQFFETPQGFIGLSGSDYESFEKIVEQISIRREVKCFLSQDFVSKIFFKWFEGQYKGTLSKDIGFIQYIVDCSEEDVKKFKVAIPISYLDIEEPFTIGHVIFEFYTKEFFDNLEIELTNKNPAFEKDGLKNIRKQYQGVVFASHVVLAEKERANEIAVEETEKALMVLRFFSPSVIWPEIPSYFGRMGQVNIPVSHSFVFEDKWPDIHSEIDEKSNFRLPIGKQQLEFMMDSGLRGASELICKSNLTEFEKLLLNSISLFTKGIVSIDYHDKLVFCLVSIETLLLKNSNEPIQYSISLRLAFLSSLDPNERKRIKDLVQDAYVVRSSYLHHGKKKQDIELLKNVQLAVWSALRKCLENRGRFQDQSQLVDFVEKLILS